MTEGNFIEEIALKLGPEDEKLFGFFFFFKDVTKKEVSIFRTEMVIRCMGETLRDTPCRVQAGLDWDCSGRLEEMRPQQWNGARSRRP